jgi:ferredoxin-NADP reductase
MAAATLPTQPQAGARMIGVQVLSVTPAARDVITLALALPGTRRAPAVYRPGQFIALAFPTTDGKTLYRSYSLCGDGRADFPWEITIKRHQAGLISNHLIDRIRPGMVLQASLPQGSFTLPAAVRPGQPIVFVAAGSGITPIYGMLRALAHVPTEQRPRVWLHYGYHSPADGIYLRELAALDPQHEWLTQHYYVSSAGYRLRAEQVVASMGAQAAAAEWYVCGPSALKRSLEAVALRQGVPAARIHAELFVSPPPRAAVPAGAAPASVRLLGSGTALDVRPGDTLLETLERHGYQPDFDCRAGACGTCRLHLLAGQVRNGSGSGGLTPAERAAGYVLACTAQPVGEVTIASPAQSAATAARRHSTRKALRFSLVAAAAGLFLTAWTFTNHSPTAQASGSGPSLPSLPSISGDDGSNSSSSNNASNGPSWFSNQPSSSGGSTSTGVS